MTYKLAFFCLTFFILGRLSKESIYIGNDKQKYDAASIGILLR